MVQIIVKFVPIGVASLIAGTIYRIDDLHETFEKLAWFIITVLIGLIIHFTITLPSLYTAVCRKNPFKFYWGIRNALIAAFGSASSTCALPITMESIETNNKIPKSISRFMLPLGCTVNMDGLALMEGVAAIYIAQLENKNLTLAEIMTLTLTATLASIGASSIPSSGLVMLTMILKTLNVPEDKVKLLWACDWLLDRFRTSVNVAGDSVGCAIVSKLLEKETCESIYEPTKYEDLTLTNIHENTFRAINDKLTRL